MTPRTALILCGGLGTRLRPLVGAVQKTVVDVGGAPFLERIVAASARGGVEKAVLCAGYNSEAVSAWFEQRAAPPKVVMSVEPSPYGTAGALRLARPHIASWPVLVLNGDSFCPLDLPAFGAFHRARGGAASIVAVPARGRADAGFLSLGDDSRVLSFSEKDPSGGQWVNAGIYILSERAFKRIGDGPSSLEKDVLPSLLEDGVYALRTDLPLWDIGTPERLRAFREEFAG